MAGRIFIRGEFLEIYPYMNWIFLVNQDGELLISRTEEIVEDRNLHDYFFRHAKESVQAFEGDVAIEIDAGNFRKIARIADQYSFSDLRFFYSNILCASNDGLHFLPFETNSESVGKCMKVTDTPISSLAAKYMTVFATSLEDSVTTLLGVKEGGYSQILKTGSEASRVGISFQRVHYYLGANNLSVADYEKSPVESTIEDENDLEVISKIDEARPYAFGEDEPDFVFNSNQGVYLKFGRELRYRKDGSVKFLTFQLGSDGRLIRTHLHKGGLSYEFLDGLFLHKGGDWRTLLEGECISTRGYSNSINYQNAITAVNDEGAHFFVI